MPSLWLSLLLRQFPPRNFIQSQSFKGHLSAAKSPISFSTQTSSWNSRFIYPITYMTVSTWISNRCFKLNIWKPTSWFSDPKPTIPPVIKRWHCHPPNGSNKKLLITLVLLCPMADQPEWSSILLPKALIISLHLFILFVTSHRLLPWNSSLPFLSSSIQFSTCNL